MNASTTPGGELRPGGARRRRALPRGARWPLAAVFVVLLAGLLMGAHPSGDVHFLRTELAEAKAQLRVARALQSAASAGAGTFGSPGVLGSSVTMTSSPVHRVGGGEAASDPVRGAEQRVAAVSAELASAIRGVKHAGAFSGILDQVHSLITHPRDPGTAGRLRAPVRGVVTSGFGARRVPAWGYDNMHDGIDLFAPAGTSVTAAGDGHVAFVGYRDDSGHSIVVDHGHDGGGRRLHTIYSHLSTISVREGDRVLSGDELGAVGTTGRHSTGPHLHFEVRLEGEPVDPRAWL